MLGLGAVIRAKPIVLRRLPQLLHSSAWSWFHWRMRRC